MIVMTRWLTVLALMVSIGLHTAVIQSVAWAQMVVSYSLEKGSMAQGVADTFDGKHACPLCKLAQKTKKAADDSTAPADEARLKLHLTLDSLPRIVFSQPPAQGFFTPADEHPRLLTEAPRTPPPRTQPLG